MGLNLWMGHCCQKHARCSAEAAKDWRPTKGTSNKKTVERQAAIPAIKASGKSKSPMAFFADLLGNEQAPLSNFASRQLRCCKLTRL